MPAQALDAFGDADEDNDVSGYRGNSSADVDDGDVMVSTESHPASLHFISVRLPNKLFVRQCRSVQSKR